MKKAFFFSLFLLGTILLHSQYDPNFELRINCGTTVSTTYNGNIFDPDQYFDGGGTYTRNPGGLVQPYTTERYDDDKELNYNIPLENGDYQVILHFAEVYHSSTGRRIFDVSIEGVLALNDFDLYAVNGQSPITREFNLTIIDGSLDIYISGLVADGGVDNPKISAIEVLATSSGDTHAPTAPTLSTTATGETTIDLAWSGATDNIGVTGYKVYNDATVLATLGNVTSYQVTGLTASTAYMFKVRALDAAGNESPDSNILNVSTDDPPGGGGTVWSDSNGVASYTGDVAIGVGSVPAGYKLAVEGKIRTREVRVDQDNWPDYVFEEGYELPTLEEVEKHIIKYGHLPKMPSAREVDANGVELGKINKLLLEKVEELTLYVLELKKEIESLKQN